MTNIVNGLKTIEDFANTRQAQQQALQSGAIDALSKQNIYATQVLSGVAATGNQVAYDAARKHLSDNGIDISSWAPDVQTGAQQTQAARLAQSPLGSLLNAGLKQQSNDIALSGLTGQLPPQGLNIGGTPIVSIQALQHKPWTNPDTIGMREPNSPPQIASSSTIQSNVSAPIQAGGFRPPSQMQGETLPSYRARVEQAFQQYKETPQAVRSKEAASNQGKTDVQNLEASNKAQELTDRLTKNLQAMLRLNDSVPQSGFVPAGGKAYISRALGANKDNLLGKIVDFAGGDTTGDAATAYDQWNQINNQQVLSEIQQFVASGGANARVNQTLEKIAQAASSIHPEASPQSRKAQIENALSELQNKNISGQNLVKANQGQPSAVYKDLPVTTGMTPAEQAAQKLDLFLQSKQKFDNKKKPVIDASEYFK